MLTRLDIRNVVLIDRLTLAGEAGLSALTGETGAGKSILLDALGLALGMRAEAGLVRKGEDQAAVTASFDLKPAHPALARLAEQGIEAGDGALILRRTLSADGRSKAFINDTPVSVQLLRETGALLVDIHSQFATQGLLDPATHIDLLDRAARVDRDTLAALYATLKAARAALDEADHGIATLRLQEDYLRHAVAELDKLAPVEGEEEQLAARRIELKNIEKSAQGWDSVSDLIDGDDGLRQRLHALDTALNRLERADLRDAAARALAEIDEISYQSERARLPAAAGERLEDVEERYFALRDAARKYRTTADQLPAVLADMTQKLRLITDHDAVMAERRRAVAAAEKDYRAAAEQASAKRKDAAQKLAAAVNAELPGLRLEKAVFSVDIRALDNPDDWGPAGTDRVTLMVSTNPGAAAAPLHKTASGGEMSRLMLAIKLVMAATATIPTLVFDEADSGIGGATADAVGERLQRLSATYQVLTVTHSPQVAARAQHHWHISKTSGATTVTPLARDARVEEIARMLSGATVTAEARAQAEKLLSAAPKKKKNAA